MSENRDCGKCNGYEHSGKGRCELQNGILAAEAPMSCLQRRMSENLSRIAVPREAWQRL